MIYTIQYSMILNIYEYFCTICNYLVETEEEAEVSTASWAHLGISLGIEMPANLFHCGVFGRGHFSQT